MKQLLTLLVVISASIAVALVAKDDPGHIRIVFLDHAIETSVIFFTLLCLLLATVIFYAGKLLLTLWRSPMLLGRWNHRRRSSKAHNSLTKGSIAMAEGRWATAEKYLTNNATASETPLVNYLSAAKAAHKQGAHKRAERYLLLARKNSPTADLAIWLTQAELQIEEGQFSSALKTLEKLKYTDPNHEQVMRLAIRLYVELEDYENLLSLCEKIKNQRWASKEEIKHLQVLAHRNLLRIEGLREQDRDITAVWERIPKALRSNEKILGTYAQLLISQGQGDIATPLLYEAIHKQWSSQLVYLFGLIKTQEPGRQLRLAEKWLHEHKNDAHLLLSLGRLSRYNGQLDRSQEYLERCILEGSLPEAYRELGKLLQEQGDEAAALTYFDKSLTLLTSSGLSTNTVTTKQLASQ